MEVTLIILIILNANRNSNSSFLSEFQSVCLQT